MLDVISEKSHRLVSRANGPGRAVYGWVAARMLAQIAEMGWSHAARVSRSNSQRLPHGPQQSGAWLVILISLDAVCNMLAAEIGERGRECQSID